MILKVRDRGRRGFGGGVDNVGVVKGFYLISGHRSLSY